MEPLAKVAFLHRVRRGWGGGVNMPEGVAGEREDGDTLRRT